ncbi:MAG TPA: substrate-binding domain-containing protein [Flavisolibacter sp.]|jgi:LacI family transcriptional regulator|nr:substrate-binding domain-containing protein [Flavisolibacter sp.]
MPRINCTRCHKTETVLKSGFVRGKQRFFCKECKFHFTIFHESRKKNGDLKKHQTTIVDIAKAVGYSTSTVSRALHDHEDISLQTREAIKLIAAEMNYQPNLLAQGFAKKQTNTIGVIIPNLETTFFSIMLMGIQKVATAYGYNVMICQSNESYTAEITNIQTLMSNWIDGLLICHSIETETFEHIRLHMNKGIPIVHFYRVCMETNTPKVVAYDTKGSEEIIDHLIQQGCKRIAIIVGANHLLITKNRLKGYQNALKKNHLPYDDKLVAFTKFTRQSTIQVIDEWLQLEVKPDAIFSISDKCAVYTILHLKSKGIRIPEEICVAGFGNDPMGEVIEPGLTTYDSKTLKIGETAAELFFNQVLNDDNQVKQIKTIKGNIIIRGSSIRR